MSARPLRVVFAEDSFLLREGVLRLLATRAEIDVVGTCEDLPSLVALVDAECPDVAVTDIRMPPTHLDEGIRAANRFRASHPELGVVVLSQYVLPDYAVALFEHGSAGRAYLLKERVADLEQLLGAICEVSKGGSVVDPKIVDALIAGRARRSDSPLDALTPREREILGEMAQGKSNAAIAASLVLTERAVEKHTNAIFTRLGLSYERDINKRVKAVLLYLAEERD